MVLLSVLASAENDSVTTGPYKVSFDLGIPKSSYKLSISPAKASESLGGEKSTEYSIEIINKTGTFRRASIALTHNEEDQIVPSADEMAAWLNKLWSGSPENSDIITTTRRIDGVIGATGSFVSTFNDMGIQNYGSLYYTYFDPRKLVCEIYSAYPWDEGTLQLLKTIHIEKLKG